MIADLKFNTSITQKKGWDAGTIRDKWLYNKIEKLYSKIINEERNLIQPKEREEMKKREFIQIDEILIQTKVIDASDTDLFNKMLILVFGIIGIIIFITDFLFFSSKTQVFIFISLLIFSFLFLTLAIFLLIEFIY